MDVVKAELVLREQSLPGARVRVFPLGQGAARALEARAPGRVLSPEVLPAKEKP